MFKDKLKALVAKKDVDEDIHDDGNKRKIENLVFLVIILIITIVVINYIWNENKTSDKTITNSNGKKLASNVKTDAVNSNSNSAGSDLEDRLESILAKIEGVGEVKVFVNYSESNEIVPMYNDNSKSSVTEETDTSGGVRKVEQNDSDKEIVYQEENRNEDTYCSEDC